MLMKKERNKETKEEKGERNFENSVGMGTETLPVQTLDAPPRLTSGDRLGK
jgi:hypothetical protein